MREMKRFAAPLMVLLLLIFVGCAATESQRTTGVAMDDAGITAKVKTALSTESATKARDIKVDTFRGVVQLSGFVDNQAVIDRATEIARSVEGVRDVKNNLTVKTEIPPRYETK